MNPNHLYFYCPRITRTGGSSSAKASLLSPIRVYDLDVFAFAARLLAPSSSFAAQCQVAMITEFSSGQDQAGLAVVVFGDESYKHDLALEAISTAQNQITLNFEGDTPTWDGPLLVTTNTEAVFIRKPVKIDLLCSTVSELPDFKANLHYLRSFEIGLQDVDMPLSTQSYADELLAYGQKAHLGSEFVVPFWFKRNDKTVGGTIVLGTLMPNTSNRYSGWLYVFHESDQPEVGDILLRQVNWEEDRKQHSHSSLIARIVSID